jgi:hypothetical protein
MSKYEHLLKVIDEDAPVDPPSRAITCDEVAERIKAWLRIVDNPPRNCTKTWKDLADATEAFALGCWAYAALMAGWSDAAIFAIDEGLVPQQLRRGLHLMNIDVSAATVMNRKGELEHFRRPRISSPPWWQDQRVAAHRNTSALVARKGQRS